MDAKSISKKTTNTEEGIDKENLNYLMKKLKYTGFPDNKYTRDKVSEIMESKQSGTFTHYSKDDLIGFNDITFDVKINKASSSDKFYFGGYDATLINNNKDIERSISMASTKNTYTARQAVNLLEGRMVKRKFSNDEIGFVGIDFNSEKNKYGNHKLKIVSQKDKIDVNKAVENSSIVIYDRPKYDKEKLREFLINALEKGNLVNAFIKLKNGEEIEGKVMFNPFQGKINHYDHKLKLINDSDLENSQENNKKNTVSR